MEDSRMNSILRLALDTVQTGKWHDKSDFDFQSDEEIELYVCTVDDIKKSGRADKVWSVPTD